jgi:hypothetical protein
MLLLAGVHACGRGEAAGGEVVTAFEVKIEVQHTYLVDAEAEDAEAAEERAAQAWWSGDVDWKNPVDSWLMQCKALAQGERGID